ncbi:MAG: hypothetical protein QM703_25065 [Gemmatales bacterium]
MFKRTRWLTVAVIGLGMAFGWLAASGQLSQAFAQDKSSKQAASGSSPEVLPRPDFRYQGNVGRTILDSDKPQFPQPVQPPKGAAECGADPAR